jgi:hypothetical protein
MGASSVRRWLKHFKDGNTDIANQPRCGRPRTAATERKKKHVDELITKDRRITFREISAQLGVGQHAVQEMVEFWDIGMFVPVGFPVCIHRSTERYAEMRHHSCFDSMLSKRVTSFFKIVTGDESYESCFYHLDPETK